jgi:hypothetical protein
VVEVASSSYPRSTRSMARDASVLLTARLGLFHIPSDPRKTQNEFVPFVVGPPSVNDRLLEANRTYIHHHQRKRSGCSVWTSRGDRTVARARWASYTVSRDNRTPIVAPD